MKGAVRMKWAVAAGVIAQSLILAGAVPGAPVQASTAPPNRMAQWPWSSHGFAEESLHFATIPYPVKTVADSTLPQGQTLLLQPGRPGTEFCVGSVTTVVSAPVEQVVAQGTAPVHAISIGGVSYTYDRVFSVLTTAYNGQYSMNGPSGAVAAWDGLPLHPGDVAVDPNIIPLGTYLYIDGYGPARAVDTGSAIIGDHIDLFFQEPGSQVSRYGIQFHKVYVLTARPASYHG